MLGVAAHLVGSQEGLSSVELIHLVILPFSTKIDVDSTVKQHT
jgi:hypothetical protein